jgi:hypothetical protein
LGATRKLAKRTVIIVFIAPKATFTAESGSQQAILRVLRPPAVSNLAGGKNVFGHYNRLFPSSCDKEILSKAIADPNADVKAILNDVVKKSNDVLKENAPK